MGQPAVCIFLLLTLAACRRPDVSPKVLSVCELSRNFSAYQGKSIAVRGVYFNGLRQQCSQKCMDGLWPSFIEVRGGAETPVLAALFRQAQAEAKQGRRVELWVTIWGRLNTNTHFSPLGPCDPSLRGFGRLGLFPAEIVVERFSEMELRSDPSSPYDYANIAHVAP